MIKPKLNQLAKPAHIDNIRDGWAHLDREMTKSVDKIAALAKKVESVGNSAGDNDALKAAVIRMELALAQGKDLTTVITSSLDIRALGVVVSKVGAKFPLTQSLFDHLGLIRKKPSLILIENLRQHYLTHYDCLYDQSILERWILSALRKRDRLGRYSSIIFSSDGARWLATSCIQKNKVFNDIVNKLGLDKYQSGRFIRLSQQIYFVEQLRHIPVNEPNALLEEVQIESVYNSPYGEKGLLGHEILRTLISRAPRKNIHDSWQNVVMKIAGDPRIPMTHPRYQKWWLHIDQALINKVIEWLSGFDLRLFLEALEDYSIHSNNDELLRMYPPRRQFLQGLLDKDLVIGTRLYLTNRFREYLNKNYDKEHLPELYTVNTGDKSVIHVELDRAQLIEGSHSCKLWIYTKLLESAVVFDYTKRSASYDDLTSGLASKMKGGSGQTFLVDSITHYPALNWQKKALEALNTAGVSIAAKDVLTDSDYLKYKRKFGVM